MQSHRILGVFVVLVAILVALGVGMLMLLRSAADDSDDDIITIDPDDAQEVSVDLGASRGSPIDPPLPLEDFSLPATTGTDFDLSESAGKIKLIYFGYLTCPDFCPTTMADLTRVYRELGEPADDLTVMLITVDPQRDDMARLTAYVGAFHDDFIGLRGTDESVQGVMAQFGAVAVQRDVDSALGYLVDHTASVFMVDRDNNVVYRFAYGTDVDGIVEDVRTLLDDG
jgi:protein SCO1/2